MLIYGIGTTLCASSQLLLQLLLFRIFTGLGIGGEWAAGQSLIAETVPPARRARYAAYVQVGAPLGAMLAAAAGGHIEPLIGWRNVFLLSSAPSFIVAAIVWRWLPESDVWLRRANADAMVQRGLAGALRPYRRIIGLLFVVLLVNSAAYWFTYTLDAELPAHCAQAHAAGERQPDDLDADRRRWRDMPPSACWPTASDAARCSRSMPR